MNYGKIFLNLKTKSDDMKQILILDEQKIEVDNEIFERGQRIVKRLIREKKRKIN